MGKNLKGRFSHLDKEFTDRETGESKGRAENEGATRESVPEPGLESRIEAEAEVELAMGSEFASGSAGAGAMADEEFEAQLTAVLQADNSGKKKKRDWKKPWKSLKNWKSWSKKRKILTVGGAVMVLLLIMKMSGGGDKASVMPVMTTAVMKGDIQEKLVVNGPVEGTDSVEVVSSLHAEIVEMPVKEGDRVQKDQVLATLDTTDIQREVDIAQNSYDRAVSDLDKQTREVVSGYAKAAQDYADAARNLDRVSTLFQLGGSSQVELEAAQNAANDAKRQMDLYIIKDGQPVPDDSYALQVETARLELEQKKKRLEDTQLKSPITGTVVRVNTKVGRFADTIDDDQPIFIIDNLDTLEMKIKISEFSIGKIAIGQPVEISADILGGDTVSGEVTAISPTGEEKGGGSTERVIPTTVRINDKGTKLIAGITAKADILLAESKDTLIVPISSLIQKEDGIYLAAVENSKVKLIGVETGVENDIQVEIIPKEGYQVDENTQIVTTPDPGFTDGMPVVVLPSM